MGLFREALGDIVIVGAALEVLEWQHCQRRARGRFDICDEPVALALNGLNETGTIGGIMQRAADLANHRVEAGVDVDEHVAIPETLDDLVARDELSPPVHEQHEQLQRPAFDPDSTPVLTQLER